jgi:hypothetical protein
MAGPGPFKPSMSPVPSDTCEDASFLPRLSSTFPPFPRMFEQNCHRRSREICGACIATASRYGWGRRAGSIRNRSRAWKLPVFPLAWLRSIKRRGASSSTLGRVARGYFVGGFVLGEPSFAEPAQRRLFSVSAAPQARMFRCGTDGFDSQTDRASS